MTPRHSIFLQLFILTILWARAEAVQCTYESRRLPPGTHTVNCVRVTCNADGTVTSDMCPVYAVRCAPGYHSVWREQDNSKPFPECCRIPSCVPD